MADRRLLAQDITDSGQVEQLVRSLGGRDGLWAAVLFTWMVPFWDDDGRLIGKPAALRSKILSRYQDLVAEAEVAEALAVMNDVDLVVWYEVIGSPGERYLYSPRFSVHQTLRTDRYGPSRLPPPPGWHPPEGHPMAKNPNLAKEKPQRDTRRTARIPKRPVNTDGSTSLATSGQPAGNQPEPAAQPAGNRDAYTMAPSGDEASPRASSPLLSSRLPSAVPRVTAADSSAGAQAPVEDARDLAATVTGTKAEVEHIRQRVVETIERAEEPWATALQAIASETAAGNFLTWFEHATFSEVVHDDDQGKQAERTVWVRNGFEQSWITEHYRDKLKLAVELVSGVPGSLVILVRDGASEVAQLEPEIPDAPIADQDAGASIVPLASSHGPQNEGSR